MVRKGVKLKDVISVHKFISSFHLPPVVGDEKNTKYKTHSKLGEREDSIQGTVNL